MGGGYVLNFSDRTFAEFFEDELHVNTDDPKYQRNGTSKAKRLRAYLEIESEADVAKTLRALWGHREAVSGPFDAKDEALRRQKERFFEIIHSIEGAMSTARTDAIEKFAENQTPRRVDLRYRTGHSSKQARSRIGPAAHVLYEKVCFRPRPERDRV